MAEPKALISGGLGFIGSHIVEHCRNLGMEVTIVDNLSSGYEENVPGLERYWKRNLHSEGSISYMFETEGPFDYIYHCAAYAAEVKSHERRAFTYHNNIVGSANLIQQAMDSKTCKRFVFVSSAAVYGKMTNHAISELEPTLPADPYGISKRATELDLRISGLPYTIFRAHNVYGPRQNMNDPDRNVIAIFMKQCLEGKPMTIYGDGSQRRQFSYIDDVAPYIARAPLNPGSENRTFNIGSDEDYRVSAIAEEVARAIGGSNFALTKHLPERKEVKCVRVSHEAFKEVFQPSPTVPIDEGIRRMAEWAKSR